MISRTLEWHRIVNAKPLPETVDRRTSAITDLVKAYSDAKDWTAVLQSVAGVVAGFESGHAQDSAGVTLIIQVLKARDSTVPNDITDNALELRAAAATALSEIIGRNPDKYPDVKALMIAASLDSGLAHRPRPKERYLKIMLDELNQNVQSTLNRAQEAKRRRIAPGKKILAIDTEVAAEPAEAIKALTAAVKSMATEFSTQAGIDREELEILWWLFSGASSNLRQAIAVLTPGQAALAIGVEIANLCLLPAPANAVDFVKRSMDQVRKADAKRTFEKLFDESDSNAQSLLLSSETAKTLAAQYPTIFPLSWLCLRLKTSNITSGWAAEYLTKTGLDATQPAEALAIAQQALKERIGQRLYASLVGG